MTSQEKIVTTSLHKPHILIVDDDQQICQLVQEYLEKYNYRVSIANNGIEMRRILKKFQIDLVLLDIMLPRESGIDLCRELRETSDVSVIMLSAVEEEADRVMSLEIGADDYLTKPFSLRELLARIKSLLRRASGTLAESRKTKYFTRELRLKFADWTLEVTRHRLIAPDGVVVPLSHGEYEILLAFLEHPGHVLTRDQLLDQISDREAAPFDRSIDVLVGRLRKKIEPDPKNPHHIITVRSAGYKLVTKVISE